MEKILKWLPVVSLFTMLVASTAVSQYQVSQLVDQVSNLQKTMADVVIQQAKTDTKLEYFEKEKGD